MLKRIKNFFKSKRVSSLGELEKQLEIFNSSLMELSERMSSIEEEIKRIDEKINVLEEQNENQTLVNYGLMRELGMIGGNYNEY